MSKDILLLAAVGAGVYLVLNKQAQARQVVQQGGQYLNPGNIPSSGVKTSVNADMWARLMGNGFTSLVKGLYTSDGKPVSGADAASTFYNQLQSGDVMSLPDTVIGTGGDLLEWDAGGALGGLLA
jgi:phage-related tail fiber protein